MIAEEKELRSYADRMNLLDEDVVFIASLMQKAVAAEREACAKLADEMARAASLPGHPNADSREGMAGEIAVAIRCRSQAGA